MEEEKRISYSTLIVNQSGGSFYAGRGAGKSLELTHFFHY